MHVRRSSLQCSRPDVASGALSYLRSDAIMYSAYVFRLSDTCAVHAQVDALIIGGMWGRKARSGILGEYVLALADGPAENSMSPFLSFCRSVLCALLLASMSSFACIAYSPLDATAHALICTGSAVGRASRSGRTFMST